MTHPFTPAVGAVHSADIAVPEHEREKQFYSRVLCTGANPRWLINHGLMNNLGMPIIGLGKRIPAYEGLPLQWMPHIQVADVGKSAQTAIERGGRELMHHKNKDGSSAWAVLEDPNGAAFGIIPLVSSDAAAAVAKSATESDIARSGRIMWLDLTVPNADSTRDFYRDVVGWCVQDVEMKDGDTKYADYNMLNGNGEPAAGICHARGVNTGLKPVWMMYLPVDDMAESLRIAQEEGGKVLKTMQRANGEYLHAVIEDPVGVVFAIVQGEA